MHRMGMVRGRKCIYVTACCFCVNAEITNCVRCSVHLNEQDGCPEYLRVDSVKKRTDELFDKLPAEYGMDAFC